MPSRTMQAGDNAGQKQRLQELLALARTYRGWSQRQLADELGRDVHNLVPDSGVPKLDLVVRLAETLDWSVQDVVDDICGVVPALAGVQSESMSWTDLDREAYRAHCEGRFTDLVAIARREYRAATTGDERARACAREAAGWEGQGRYTAALEKIQRGLRESNRSDEVSLKLRTNLANLHYLLGQTHEAEGIATTVLQAIDSNLLSGRFLDGSRGYCLYVRGNCYRVYAANDERHSTVLGERAIADLDAARELLQRAFSETAMPVFASHATIAAGAIIAIEVMLGRRKAAEALDLLLAGLEPIIDPRATVDPAHLEALGWWCIFGAEIAVRDDEGRARLDQRMAIFTNKAEEIAEALGNWSLRERVWTLELARRRPTTGSSDEPWVIDADDVRTISGAMARFPTFREIGWQVLRSSRQHAHAERS